MIDPIKDKFKKSNILGYGEGFEKDYRNDDIAEAHTSRQLAKIEEEMYKLKKEKEKIIIARQAMPRTDEDKIEKIKIKSEKVVGSLFDRVNFLKSRISELQENIAMRGKLHDEIVQEIEVDISEKSRLSDAISDSNERRNLKLDVSVLRKEKRHEAVQFWKDVMEITIELKQLKEEFETESKIAQLFVSDDIEIGSDNI